MVIVRIQKIIWDKYNTEHIKKHNVSIEEVELVIKSDTNTNAGYSGKKLLTGRVGNRLITVVGKIAGNKIHIVTARDASSEERQDYYKYEKGKEN